MQESKRSPRNIAMILDLIHIVVGILVVVCAVLAFINPERNRLMFPLIFGLAAFLNGINGAARICYGGKDRKKKLSGFGLCMVALVLLLISMVSMISIWR